MVAGAHMSRHLARVRELGFEVIEADRERVEVAVAELDRGSGDRAGVETATEEDPNRDVGCDQP